MRGVVYRIVVAVAESQTSRIEAAGAVADQIHDGGEFGGHACVNAWKPRSIEEAESLHFAHVASHPAPIPAAAAHAVAHRARGYALDLATMEEFFDRPGRAPLSRGHE